MQRLHASELTIMPKPQVDDPLRDLSRERARIAGHAGRSYTYRPQRQQRPGGDLDDPATLPRVLPAASADSEVMLLCVGGVGALRTGAGLVLNLRSLGLHHMLLLAPERRVCERMWEVFASVACVYWPSRILRTKRPESLYNTKFSPLALAIFEARKVLLERLVLDHHLNVLHLDADAVFFANPYPLLKGPMAKHALIAQVDGPFVNAGVFYVQHVVRGDAAAWALQELNRRINRFTYQPESVAALPHSRWARPPYFANADEQAILNDVVASSLRAVPTHAGVELSEPRFKTRFAPRNCNGRGVPPPGCDGVAEAAQRQGGSRWFRTVEAELTGAKRYMRRAPPLARPEARRLAQLCRADAATELGSTGTLHVPGNASASAASLLVPPQWMFAHFPYGDFFGSMRRCHDGGWAWGAMSALERRLCAPEHKVPVVMMHMAGLRQEQWGRRTLVRALGVWHPAADAVVPEAWVSARASSPAVRRASTPAARRAAWAAEAGRLLVTELPRRVLRFRRMGEFDMFAARLLLLGLLTGRRVVVPPIDCDLPWMRRALEPRHLRGFEVGCGEQRQCIWLPYPHHIDPWCAGIDFLNDVDYRELRRRSVVNDADAVAVSTAEVAVAAPRGGGGKAALAARAAVNGSGGGGAASSGPVALGSGSRAREARVVVLRSDGDGKLGPAGHETLQSIPLGGFRTTTWRAPFARQVERTLRSPDGMALGDEQMKVVKDCLRSLATSKE